MREMLIGAIIEEAIRINCIYENVSVVLTLTREKELIIEHQVDGENEEYWKQWVISSKNNEKYLNSVLEELKAIR